MMAVKVAEVSEPSTSVFESGGCPSQQKTGSGNQFQVNKSVKVICDSAKANEMSGG
jgi:hypothetical protein